MATTSTNSLEMGEQVPKKNTKLIYGLGAVAMVVAIGVVITLVVLLSGNEGGEAAPIVSTEGPTTPVFTTTTTLAPATDAPTEAPTVAPTVAPTDPSTEPPTVAPTESPDADEIALDSVMSGAYSPASFSGSWTSGGEVLFRNENGDLVLYDVATSTTTPLIQNTSEILQQASRFTQLSADSAYVALAYNVVPVYRHSFLARYAAVDIATNDVVDILPSGIASTEGFLQNFVWGPSETSCAFVYLNNIFYKPNLTSEPQQISTSGQLNVIYNGIPDWVYEEEVFGTGNAMWFSDDGAKLAYITFDDSAVRVMRVPHYGVPGSVEYQYTQHHEIRYPKPGTTNPTVYATLVDLASGNSTVYNAPSDLEQPIIRALRFVGNDSVALMWTNRVQTSLIVQLCVQTEANCSEIYSYAEEDGWIDNIPFIFNSAADAFITILPQAVDGVLYKQIVQVSSGTNTWTASDRTNTAHTVLEILLWTSDNVIWYKATRVNDSAEQHIYRVDAANDVTCFTCDIRREDGGECLYNDASISSDGNMLAINCAGPEVPQTLIYNSSGSLVQVWETNEEVASLVSGRNLPQTIRMSVPVAAGLPEADVHITVPNGYLNRTNVPLLVNVYGGPDSSQVTKQWSIDWGTSLVSRWGIAVAHIDGRGSGLRGVTNTFTLNRRLGSVEVEDQINVTRYLQNNLSWLDANRTCIWGWSYGGYVSSLSLARGDDVFRCAIAVAPVVDWRFYDTVYTERYMDIPANNTQGYAESSLLTDDVVEAYRSKRYLLVHGTADDNVHYQHSMLISRLLQRRDVYFTQMSYTDEDHGLGGVRAHLYHGLEKFLQDNML